MFNELQNTINDLQLSEETAFLMQEMAEAPEDDILDTVIISKEEEKKIVSILNKIPDTNLENEKDSRITDKTLEKEMKSQPDPSIEELLED